jgi:hypothetical protein
MRSLSDAICDADLGAELEPTDVCITCFKEIPVGFLRCEECAEALERAEEFEINATGPRDPRH